MKKLSVSLDEDHVARLDERQDGSEITSKSAALRDILDEYETLRTEYGSVRTECEDLRTRIDDLKDDLAEVREERDRLEGQADRVEQLETEVERLKNEKRQILEQRKENQELVRYVEDERTAQQRWREAGIVTRTKWKLLGMPESET